MISQKELYYIDQRLLQAKNLDTTFGGMMVVIFGDPEQLPPVLGKILWDSGSDGDDSLGFTGADSIS